MWELCDPVVMRLLQAEVCVCVRKRGSVGNDAWTLEVAARACCVGVGETRGGCVGCRSKVWVHLLYRSSSRNSPRQHHNTHSIVSGTRLTTSCLDTSSTQPSEPIETQHRLPAPADERLTCWSAMIMCIEASSVQLEDGSGMSERSKDVRGRRREAHRSRPARVHAHAYLHIERAR